MTTALLRTTPSLSHIAPLWLLQLLADFGTSH